MVKNTFTFESLKTALRSHALFSHMVIESKDSLDGFPGFPGKCTKIVFVLNPNKNKRFSLVFYVKGEYILLKVFNYDRPEDFYTHERGRAKKKFSSDTGRQNDPYILKIEIKKMYSPEPRWSFWIDQQSPAKHYLDCKEFIDNFLIPLKPFLVSFELTIV